MAGNTGGGRVRACTARWKNKKKKKSRGPSSAETVFPAKRLIQRMRLDVRRAV